MTLEYLNCCRQSLITRAKLNVDTAKVKFNLWLYTYILKTTGYFIIIKKYKYYNFLLINTMEVINLSYDRSRVKRFLRSRYNRQCECKKANCRKISS